jgi:thymidylate synthase
MDSPQLNYSWPVCFSDLLTIGNSQSSVGIITLWTKKEFVLKHLSPNSYALVGQLYSRDEGLNGIIRNCLANKFIRHLVVVGVDLNGSGNALLSFFQHGIDAAHAVVGMPDILIDKEIPASALLELRNHVQVHDYRKLKDFSQLPSILTALPPLSSYGDASYFPATTLAVPETYPSEKSGFIVHHDFIGPAWLEILSLIRRFGTVKKSDYGINQRELLNIVSVIDSENPDAPVFSPYFQFTRDDLFSYYPQVLTASTLEGVEYSYGQRMRNHNRIDQIQTLISSLRQTPHTRRALAVTWDIEKDVTNEKPPCLILVEFLVQQDKLFLTAFFRSNDMFHAWPRNAFGLRKLQYFVSHEVGISPGSITIISSSAHIYQNNWAIVDQLLSQYHHPVKRIGDPRGNLILRVHDGSIVITHTDPAGKRLDEFTGADPFLLYQTLVLDHRVCDLSHAFYLGTELQKAALALQKKIPYVQDKELLL